MEEPNIQEIKEPEVKETDDGGLEVSLEEDNLEPKEEVKPEVKEEPKQDPLRNKVYAQDRILAKLQREQELKDAKIAELEARLTPEPEIANLDELDKMAQTDWKGAVRKLARQEAEALRKIDQQKIQLDTAERERKQILVENERRVLERYPELNESTSEHSQIWWDKLNQNPRWRTSPDGPILVMREMEDELRNRGYDIGQKVTKAVSQERMRLANANATSLEPARTKSSNKIVLSKEQREFCETNGLSYEVYARTLRKTGEIGGVEL